MRCVREYDRTRSRVGLDDLHGEVVGPLESPYWYIVDYKIVATVPLFAAGTRLKSRYRTRRSCLKQVRSASSHDISGYRHQDPSTLSNCMIIIDRF
jgi:hypothetical protein